MSRTNTKTPAIHTHEGAKAQHINTDQQLRRSVLSCLLWESEFYEDGQEIAARIQETARNVAPEKVMALAVEARGKFNLRHAPLWLLLSLLGRKAKGTAAAIAETIQRADELTELLAMYWKDGKQPLAKALQRGLAHAFRKFDAYQLAKYDRANAIRLRDVLFLSHAKPKDAEQSATWKQLVEGTLPAPDTWEVGLSGGADKRETFERLLREGKLGYLALLRNLRNMVEAKVDASLIREAILARKGAHRVLPFRFVAAARAVPQLEPVLDEALVANVEAGPRLSGRTIVLVDVSGSMNQQLSAKSDLKRMDAAATLSSVISADSLRVFSFSSGNIRSYGDRWDGKRVSVEVPPRRGMAGVDAVVNSQAHAGTLLGQAVKEMNAEPHDRLIVVTDEQSQDPVPEPVAKRAYLVNVASNRNGIGYGRWTHIDGFSEAVITYISESEALA